MFSFRLFLGLVFISVTSQVHADKPTEDVVCLKDGSIIRGEFIEQVLGENVRIQTTGGSIIVLKASEIRTINKEPQISVANKKIPILAGVMSFLIPGSGQFYTGDYALGATYFSLFTAGVAFFYAGFEDNVSMGDRGNLDVEKDDWKTRVGYLLWVNALADSAADAYTSAKRYNERNQLRARLRFAPIMLGKNGVGAMLSYAF